MSDKPVWQIKFYGTRGSTPVCEPGFQLFGGNTTCIYTDLLINDRSKMIVVFDAGTGIRKLGKDIINGKIPNTETILLIFTHLHWDHIQGFPFFEPAYNPQQNIGIFYPKDELHINKLKQLFEVQMQKEYFPVQLENMGANFHFFNSEEYKAHFKIEDYVSITYREHKHPGGAFSYRFEAKGRSIVICTDLEHGETIDREVVDFCQGADLLIHDAQYSDEELSRHRGWGHSSFSQAIEVAELSNSKQLIITHHDPDHNDEFLIDIEKKCRQRFSNCMLAREGIDFLI
jgi:phosphoribosyl 1,2-cyclic phosphodiesterase